MKIKETGEMDDTNPLNYTGPPKVDPKTGEPLDKNGKKIDPNKNPIDDKDVHQTKEIPDDELKMGPSPVSKMHKDMNEWVNVLQNEFDEYVGIDFGLTAEEGAALKSGGRDTQVSDTYINMAIGNLAENQTKGTNMANKKILTDELREVGLKPKIEETPKSVEPKTMKDYMNLGASKVVLERKKEFDKRVIANTLTEVPMEPTSNKLNETPLKTFQKKLNTKKLW